MFIISYKFSDFIKEITCKSYLLFFLLISISSIQCYINCPTIKPNIINVHIVCHTHLDTGWVETYQQYYDKYVKTILNSVVYQLSLSPERKFIFVEIAFFSKWWNEQDNYMKAKVRQFIENGQLEFISAGLSMNDEATVKYSDIIENLSCGHKWLNDTFGVTTKIGWQIDPFGHSREYASIIHQMGFNGLFLGRIDYQDKYARLKTKSLEFLWFASPSLSSKLFTSVLPNVYWPPPGFCFDKNCFDPVITPLNRESRSFLFTEYILKQASWYATNHTIVTMGMDFHYRDAEKWYKNLDALIEGVNSLGRIHLAYSSPSCYLKALNQVDKSWPGKLDDFFPYSDSYDVFWTGYFSSRPSLKYHIRKISRFLNIAKQLAVLSSGSPYKLSSIINDPSSTFTSSSPLLAMQFLLEPLRTTIGILQHHDAVTGTCKQKVADDYTRMITESLSSAEIIIKHALKTFVGDGEWKFCQFNISHCIHSGGQLILYNPLGHNVKDYVRLPINENYKVMKDNQLIASQIISNHHAIASLPGRPSITQHELVFRVNLPPLGLTSYSILKEPGILPSTPISSESFISNGRISLKLSYGYPSLLIIKNRFEVPFSQKFFLYKSEGYVFGKKPSGAYSFNPENSPREIALTSYKVIKGPLVQEVHQIFTPYISQVIRLYRHSDFLEFDWIVGPIPITQDFNDCGHEVITRYETNFASNRTFFTDSNGRETLRRVRDYHPTWHIEATEKIASNYYPVTSWIFIRDIKNNLQMTVVPDRSEGGSSIEDGTIELMLHRRLLADDGFGMDEALNEPGEDKKGLVVRGKHLVHIGHINEGVRKMRILSKIIDNKPLVVMKATEEYSRMPEYFYPSSNIRVRDEHLKKFDETLRGATNSRISSLRASRLVNSSLRVNKYAFNNHNNQGFHNNKTNIEMNILNYNFVGLARKLPANIHLLSLEPWNDQILIRLENFFEINEDKRLSRARRISLKNLFSSFVILEAKEMSLNGVEEKSYMEKNRWTWKSISEPYLNYTNRLGNEENRMTYARNTSYPNHWNSDSSLIITLYPMEIRTFLLKVQFF